MPHHLRYQNAEWALHHVVSRCINGFSFLRPTPAIVQICKGVLGRALVMYSKRIKLIHMVFLSNHFHFLLESEDAHALSQFVQYLKSNLSRELAREHDWQGTMWQSRFASEEILDEESLEEIFKYITENSVKEGLVDHPRAWRSPAHRLGLVRGVLARSHRAVSREAEHEDPRQGEGGGLYDLLQSRAHEA